MKSEMKRSSSFNNFVKRISVIKEAELFYKARTEELENGSELKKTKENTQKRVFFFYIVTNCY